jgi:hypothetical protein
MVTKRAFLGGNAAKSGTPKKHTFDPNLGRKVLNLVSTDWDFFWSRIGMEPSGCGTPTIVYRLANCTLIPKGLHYTRNQSVSGTAALSSGLINR